MTPDLSKPVSRESAEIMYKSLVRMIRLGLKPAQAQIAKQYEDSCGQKLAALWTEEDRND